jgi:hypothetical protein
MKATLNKWMQDVTFNYLLHNLGIKPAIKETPEERFNEWMKSKIVNVHYGNHEAMIRGYEIVKSNNKI